MERHDDSTQIRDAVQEGVARAGRSLLSTVFWTVLAIIAILVGVQGIQFGLDGAGIVAVGYVGGGLFVVVCSLYLLYSLHWIDS